jgi:hypothetical protein
MENVEDIIPEDLLSHLLKEEGITEEDLEQVLADLREEGIAEQEIDEREFVNRCK